MSLLSLNNTDIALLDDAALAAAVTELPGQAFVTSALDFADYIQDARRSLHTQELTICNTRARRLQGDVSILP